MIMSYMERKEAVLDYFEEFYNNIGYPVNQTLYATIGEAEYSKSYTQTDECCIYVNFALVLLKQNKDIEFMKARLQELINEDNMEYYMKELQEEFVDFKNDLMLLNHLLNEK